jgi:hypothetical protein
VRREKGSNCDVAKGEVRYESGKGLDEERLPFLVPVGAYGAGRLRYREGDDKDVGKYPYVVVD